MDMEVDACGLSRPGALDPSRHDGDAMEMEIDTAPLKIPMKTAPIDNTVHLSVTHTMGNRTLPVGSPEWRDLRSQILARDNRTCATCQYVSLDPRGRGMKIDHIDGDASNNNPTNLRVHCPPCEAIRHCGFHGLKGYILLGSSDMGQVEIVRKTREFFEQHGRIPRPRDIEPHAKSAGMSIVDFANMLLRVDWDDLPPEMKRFRGFFSSRAQGAQDLFSVTMPLRDGNAPDPSEYRAKEILHIEKSLPWIQFSLQDHASLPQFLDSYRPSSTKQSQVAWICISNPKLQQSDHTSDVAGLCQAWDNSCNENRTSVSELDLLARQYGVLSGKWLIFAPTNSIDGLWSKIVRATHAGTLGNSAKVSPFDESDRSHRHVICVYNQDYTNALEVNKVREGLRRLGVKDRIGYKPDIYTHCRVYANNRWNISPTRYHS